MGPITNRHNSVGESDVKHHSLQFLVRHCAYRHVNNEERLPFFHFDFWVWTVAPYSDQNRAAMITKIDREPSLWGHLEHSSTSSMVPTRISSLSKCWRESVGLTAAGLRSIGMSYIDFYVKPTLLR